VKPGELLARIAWRVGPVLLIIWAVRSGAIDYKKYVRLIKGETKSAVEMQLDDVSRLLVSEYKRTRTLPDGFRFASWLSQHKDAPTVGPRPDADPFGNSLRLTRVMDGFVVTSDGPDRKPNTADDVTKRVDGLENMPLQ
jgi:hypothetical protein